MAKRKDYSINAAPKQAKILTFPTQDVLLVRKGDSTYDFSRWLAHKTTLKSANRENLVHEMCAALNRIARFASSTTVMSIYRGGLPVWFEYLDHRFDMGATDFFKHLPPTPFELENAIMAVEDEVIRAGKWLAQGSALCTRDLGIREIAQLAGVADRACMVLSVEAVEQQFDFLAAWVQGRPGSSAGIPLDSGFAASLLILREFMHNLQFASIVIEPDHTQL